MWINLRSGRPIEQKNTRRNIDDIVTTQARKKREKEHVAEKKIDSYTRDRICQNAINAVIALRSKAF